MRTAQWSHNDKASLLDVEGIGPRLLSALVASGIAAISDLLSADDEKLWSILGPLRGKPTDLRRAAEALELLRENARNALRTASDKSAE